LIFLLLGHYWSHEDASCRNIRVSIDIALFASDVPSAEYLGSYKDRTTVA
jgi:hypothetical protein